MKFITLDILTFSNIYEQKYILPDINSVNDVTLFFSNFGGFEILKQILMELMFLLVRVRKFQILFNF